jgi:hypothetical protein
MRRRILNSIAAGMVILLLLAGCATSGGGGGTEKEVPDWVTAPPESTSEKVFFIGAGSDAGGDRAEARNQAAADLVASITRFLGVKITASTTVQARDTLESFTSELESTVTQESEARIENFRIEDSYVERRGDLVNVYLLGSYDRQALQEEKQRLQALFEERQEAISGPEAEGDRLISEGRYYRAAVQYLEAAAAAAGSQVDNAKIKYERNMNKARQAVSAINLRKVNDELQTYLGEPFPQPFEVQVNGTGSGGNQPLSGVTVKVTFTELRRNNRRGIETAEIVTDSQGRASFMRPAPDFVGQEKLTMEIDLSGALEPLEDVPDALYPQFEALEEQVRSKEVSFNYTVVSRAKEIPTAVMIADLDRGNSVIGKSETLSGVLEALSEHDFNVSALQVDAGLLTSGDARIIRTIRNEHGNRYERLIFGTVSISSFEETGDRYMVKVSGNVKVADLSTGKILYSSGNMFKSAIGSAPESAMSAAFKQFGKNLGDAMANRLP